MLNLTTHKLVMIPTAFASAFAITILPFITKNFHKGRMDDVHHQIRMMILMLLFFAIPAAVGMMILSAPLFRPSSSCKEMGQKLYLFCALVRWVFTQFSVTC